MASVAQRVRLLTERLVVQAHPGAIFFLLSTYIYTPFYTIIISEVMAVWLPSTGESQIIKNSGPDARYSST